MEEKIESYFNIGTVHYIKKAGIKNISIRLKEFNEIMVTLPRHISFQVAKEFVFSKEKWIIKHLNTIKKAEQSITIFDENTNFRTRNHQLKIIKHDKEECNAIIRDGLIRIFYPAQLTCKDKRIQKFIRRSIEEAWRLEAKHYIPARTRILAQQHNLQFKSISIKNTKAQWGSCTYDNKLSFSLHLIRLPDHLIDYIILHELTHILHKNHGTAFWNTLIKFCANAKALEKEIKTYRIEIF